MALLTSVNTVDKKNKRKKLSSLVIFFKCTTRSNFDWLELVIYFHTNEQDDEQTALTANFSDNSDLRSGLF